MKTLLILLPIVCAGLLVGCASEETVVTTPSESTSSRVKSDSTATRTYSGHDLQTGEATTGRALEKRDPSINAGRP